MDPRAELDWERGNLAKSHMDLRQGQARVAEQDSLVARLRAEGRDMREADRLLHLLRDTLAQWRWHHALIARRIAYLEARLGAAREGGDSGTPTERGGVNARSTSCM